MQNDSDSDNDIIRIPKKRLRAISDSEEEADRLLPGHSKQDEGTIRNGSESENDEDNDLTTTKDDDMSDSSSYETCYRHVENAFVAKYPGFCKMERCQERFVVGETKIIGVWFKNEFHQKKPTWICAKHNFFNSKDEREANEKLDDEERTQSDKDFIEDDDEGSTSNESGGEDNIRTAMAEITQNLRKETQKDKVNKNKFINELSRHQLEIHSYRNKALYTSREKRYKRHMRSARFDVGMKMKKNEIGGSDSDSE